MKRFQWISLLGCSAVTVAMTTSALAAETPPTTDSDKVADKRDSISDIIVTANRREERLQDVPVTVTLVDGDQLTRQNVNAVEDLTRTAPALNPAGPAGFGALSIRGIGSLAFSRSSEGSVGVVIDGVSLANTSVNPPLMFDIERVEVLEGPQGMLFGRNASAGVLNITTKAPDPSKIEGAFHGDFGSRETYVARGALNLPLSSTAALRVAGSFSQDPRVQKNLFDNSWGERVSKAVRGRFLWEPSDRVTFNISSDYNRSLSEGGVPWAVYETAPGSLIEQRLAACGVTVSPDNVEGCTNAMNYSRAETYGVSGQVDIDLGGLTLTSITAHRGVNSGGATDLDSTPTNRLTQTVKDRARNFSQELRLSGSVGAVDFVAGGYYFDGETHNRTGQVGKILADLPLIGACPLPLSVLCALPLGQFRETDTHTKSYAAFGQATVHLDDKLNLILGARLGREDVQAATTAAALETGAVGIFTPASAVGARVRDTYFIYRVGAQYQVSPDLMAFATYSRGYKGAAINDGATSNSDPLIVRPEIPKAAELGIKATLAGGKAAFNATAFYTKVRDFQAQYWDPSIPAFIFGNAPSLTSKGVTANLFGRPLRGLTANVGLTYSDVTYGPGYIVADAYNNLVDARGNQQSSKWKVTASTEYSADVSSNLDAFIQADMVYRSRIYSNAANDPILSAKGAASFGGRVGLRTSDESVGVSLYARNIFNTFRPSARFATPTAAQQLDTASFSQFSGPEKHRSVGISFDAKF